ncbi:hypothetical protein D3C73_1582590 [compost metagenome]
MTQQAVAGQHKSITAYAFTTLDIGTDQTLNLGCDIVFVPNKVTIAVCAFEPGADKRLVAPKPLGVLQ